MQTCESDNSRDDAESISLCSSDMILLEGKKTMKDIRSQVLIEKIYNVPFEIYTV